MMSWGIPFERTGIAYTEWNVFDRPAYRVLQRGVHGVELYDHSTDPEENINRASHPSYKEIQKELAKMLEAGWRHALPPEVRSVDQH